NDAINRLEGRDGNDVLNGGPGGDLMIGGRGNDTYFVDTPDHDVSATEATTFSAIIGSQPTIPNGDQAIENPNEGTDLFYSSITYTLPANVENLTLALGAGNIDGFGNALDNTIIGTRGVNTLCGYGGNDVLDGGWGADTMVGGTGNDTYYVDTAATWTFLSYIPGDQVIEYPNEGIDTVISTITYTLGDNLENLTLAPGAGNIDGYGNSLDNVIHGNDGVNTLYGYDGDDALDGGAGGDIMIGGPGNDIYYVDTPDHSIIDTGT